MAVTTAGDLIRAALGKILVLGTQDTLASADLDTGLDALNLMLESWQNESLAVYALYQWQNHPLTAGVSQYTVGPGGTINEIRPVRITNAFVRYQSVDYPMLPVDRYQYDAIAVKTIQGIPQRLFYNRFYPLGTINLYPVPSQAGMALFFDGYLPIESFANIAESFSLPPGYARAIIYNLAVELAPDFGVSVPAEVASLAAKSLGTLKRNNQQDVMMRYDPALWSPTAAYNVYSDTWR